MSCTGPASQSEQIKHQLQSMATLLQGKHDQVMTDGIPLLQESSHSLQPTVSSLLPQARCALVHSTLASLESYCRTSAPAKLLLVSQQRSSITDLGSAFNSNSHSAGCSSTSSSHSQWLDEPGCPPQIRHSAPPLQHRLYVNAHRLLDSTSSGQVSPQSVPVAHLAEALEGLFLKAPRGSRADPEVGFKIRNLHVQPPLGSELLMSVNNQ